MSTSADFEIFASAPPGLEATLCDEVREAGFHAPRQVTGGVTFHGGWPEVWRANLVLRGAGRILARVAAFRAMHLAQLDKRARKLAWADLLPAGAAVKVDTTCKNSKIYHAGAATQRIEAAIVHGVGPAAPSEAPFRILARIDDDLCTISVDTSGEPLHRRGHKEAVGKAPLRETLAALFLRQCGFVGTEPVIDPMCGSGTFVLEAAEIAKGVAPGRSRAFAFEHLASFDPQAWAQMRGAPREAGAPPMMLGYDRDAGAIRASQANADRAGVTEITEFGMQAISDLARPAGAPGLVIVNPPYGGRIGNKKLLFGLYGALGKTLLARFAGWRVGVVTSEMGLARATGLPFGPPGPPIPHGGLKIRLFQTGPL